MFVTTAIDLDHLASVNDPLISIESELRRYDAFNETHRFESKWFFKLDRKFLRKEQQLQ